MDINTLCIARDWYGVENQTVLGMTYMQALSSYSTSFKPLNITIGGMTNDGMALTRRPYNNGSY